MRIVADGPRGPRPGTLALMEAATEARVEQARTGEQASPRSPSRCSSARSTRTSSFPPSPTPTSRRRSGADRAPCRSSPRRTTRARSRRSAGSGRGHPRARRARRSRPLRPREVRRPGALADRLRARLRGDRAGRHDALGRARRAPVDRLQGDRPLRHRRAEGALAAGPRDRPQARRFRADRAERRLRRLQRPVARGRCSPTAPGCSTARSATSATAARRRAHDLRAHRGRRQGPPHRADPREGHEGLRGRRALRHDGPARQRPAPAALQRRADPARERARRAGRGLPDRDGDPQQRPHRPRHRLGRRRPRC